VGLGSQAGLPGPLDQPILSSDPSQEMPAQALSQCRLFLCIFFSYYGIFLDIRIFVFEVAYHTGLENHTAVIPKG